MKLFTKVRWPAGLWFVALALTLLLMIKADLACLAWAAKLSQEGSPSPARDTGSATGYALGQRHFLGNYERGETYRWIAATQELIAAGPAASATYKADNVPLGRPQLLPRLYMAWLAAISWFLHFGTGDSIALSVEHAALWEPVIAHALAFAVLTVFMWTRYGATSAGLAGLFFALYPPITGQFIPGTLTARTWALLFAAGAIALALPDRGVPAKTPRLGAASALVAALALWLDPAVGFPAVLILAVIGIGVITTNNAKTPFLAWSLTGFVFTLTACLADQSPWNPAAGELRYAHPLYAVAWLGLGLALDGVQRLRATGSHRGRGIAEMAPALALLSTLAYFQLKNGYAAWLYASASMRRITSLDETLRFDTAIDWFTSRSFAEIAFMAAPALFALAAVALAALSPTASPTRTSRFPVLHAAALVALLLLAFFKIRWAVVASLVALPIAAGLAASVSAVWARAVAVAAALFLFGLFPWSNALPPALRRPATGATPAASDIEALVFRHFSHWMASHNPGRNVAALAPPGLSDSLIFHGGCRALMSTAWESYPGQVAASRILSAPEASEADAVLQSREVTHLVLPSWDNVLPLLVRQPDSRDKDTLHQRLQRWVLPLYLRPVPYRLPPTPGYLDQKLAVFKVTPPQDEALSLSRLAEYFVEMDRPDPARLVGRVLAESYPDDPNAAIARALIHAHARDQTLFERELARLAADASAGVSLSSWDRRVQRTIVLALGRRRELARSEVASCAATATADDLFDLTPLQAYRLRTLATHFQVTFPERHLSDLLSSRGAGFSTAGADR